MGMLNNISTKIHNAKPSLSIDKFVQDQLDNMLKSSKLRELVERMSYSEEISKEKALKKILEKLVFYTNQISATKKISITLVK